MLDQFSELLLSVIRGKVFKQYGQHGLPLDSDSTIPLQHRVVIFDVEILEVFKVCSLHTELLQWLYSYFSFINHYYRFHPLYLILSASDEFIWNANPHDSTFYKWMMFDISTNHCNTTFHSPLKRTVNVLDIGHSRQTTTVMVLE